jgi:hypothetical protein
MYRSLDGGGHWMRWNNGLPEAAVVTELKLFNKGAGVPIYDIVASTYGRGIWRRALDGDEPTTGVTDGSPPTALIIHQATPNPFNPKTMVQFELNAPGPVAADVYDASGRHVRRLLAAPLPAGPQTVTWDGRDTAGRSAASGVYFVRITAGVNAAVQKVTLAR